MKIDMVSIMEWNGYSTLGNRNLCISVAISKLFLKLSKMLANRYPESIKLSAINLKEIEFTKSLKTVFYMYLTSY